MNIENLNKLIAHMEVMPDKAFDLSKWIKGKLNRNGGILYSPTQAKRVLEQQATVGGCNTVACIAGEAAILAVAEAAPEAKAGLIPWNPRVVHVPYVARAWLGLTETQSEKLFTPAPPGASLSSAITASREKVKRSQAIVVLKHLRDTGRVSWSAAGVRFR